ncbi:MAG: CPBP family intramembrane glutamic endopeptidase [bacterium]
MTQIIDDGNAVQAPRPGPALYVLVGIAALCWFVMFSPWTKSHVNFWVAMCTSTAILGLGSLYLDRGTGNRGNYRWDWRYVPIGIVSAIVLYGVFWSGNHLVHWLLDFAGREIDNVYSTKTQAPHWLIGVLLLSWIGPAEEIFWRGFVQRRLGLSLGSGRAFWLTTLVYALVHIWSMNLMLMVAATLCGLFWGWMYRRYNNVWPGLISHALWDCLIFVVIPL